MDQSLTYEPNMSFEAPSPQNPESFSPRPGCRKAGPRQNQRIQNQGLAPVPDAIASPFNSLKGPTRMKGSRINDAAFTPLPKPRRLRSGAATSNSVNGLPAGRQVHTRIQNQRIQNQNENPESLTPNSQCPVPNAQCPIPSAQYLTPKQLTYSPTANPNQRHKILKSRRGN